MLTARGKVRGPLRWQIVRMGHRAVHGRFVHLPRRAVRGERRSSSRRSRSAHGRHQGIDSTNVPFNVAYRLGEGVHFTAGSANGVVTRNRDVWANAFSLHRLGRCRCARGRARRSDTHHVFSEWNLPVVACTPPAASTTSATTSVAVAIVVTVGVIIMGIYLTVAFRNRSWRKSPFADAVRRKLRLNLGGLYQDNERAQAFVKAITALHSHLKKGSSHKRLATAIRDVVGDAIIPAPLLYCDPCNVPSALCCQRYTLTDAGLGRLSSQSAEILGVYAQGTEVDMDVLYDEDGNEEVISV